MIEWIITNIQTSNEGLDWMIVKASSSSGISWYNNSNTNKKINQFQCLVTWSNYGPLIYSYTNTALFLSVLEVTTLVIYPHRGCLPTSQPRACKLLGGRDYTWLVHSCIISAKYSNCQIVKCLINIGYYTNTLETAMSGLLKALSMCFQIQYQQTLVLFLKG